MTDPPVACSWEVFRSLTAADRRSGACDQKFDLRQVLPPLGIGSGLTNLMAFCRMQSSATSNSVTHSMGALRLKSNTQLARRLPKRKVPCKFKSGGLVARFFPCYVRFNSPNVKRFIGYKMPLNRFCAWTRTSIMCRKIVDSRV